MFNVQRKKWERKGHKKRAEYGSRTRLRGLGSRCTTDVLIPLERVCGMFFYGADTRTRTGDPRITNALLYQLSHIGLSPAFKLNVFIKRVQKYIIFSEKPNIP